jgi:hypothetical protein
LPAETGDVAYDVCVNGDDAGTFDDIDTKAARVMRILRFSWQERY